MADFAQTYAEDEAERIKNEAAGEVVEEGAKTAAVAATAGCAATGAGAVVSPLCGALAYAGTKYLVPLLSSWLRTEQIAPNLVRTRAESDADILARAQGAPAALRAFTGAQQAYLSALLENLRQVYAALRLDAVAPFDARATQTAIAQAAGTGYGGFEWRGGAWQPFDFFQWFEAESAKAIAERATEIAAWDARGVPEGLSKLPRPKSLDTPAAKARLAAETLREAQNWFVRARYGADATIALWLELSKMLPPRVAVGHLPTFTPLSASAALAVGHLPTFTPLSASAALSRSSSSGGGFAGPLLLSVGAFGAVKWLKNRRKH